MNIQSAASFNRGHITSRQLLRQEPQLEKLIDDLRGDTVADLTEALKSRVQDHASGQFACTCWAAGIGVAGLAASALNHPWLGLTLFAGSGIVGYNAFSNARSKNQAQNGLTRLNQAAEKTEQALLQPGADGTVVDKRFLDTSRFHSPQEVRRGDQVLSRSVEVEIGWGQHSEKFSATADVAAGTVTLRGSEGEGTFPGTLELPTHENQRVSIVRTDQNDACGYSQPTLSVSLRENRPRLTLAKGESQLTAYRGRGLGDGVVLMWDNQGHNLAVKGVINSAHLSDSWNEATTPTFNLGDGVSIKRRLDVGPLSPLQAVDVKDKMPVVGALYDQRYQKDLQVSYDAAAGTVTCGDRTVKGKLTDEGKIIMQQGDARVAQTFVDSTISLKVRHGGEDATIQHPWGGPPVARVFEEKVPCEAQDDGSYKLQMPGGPIRVEPAYGFKQLVEG